MRKIIVLLGSIVIILILCIGYLFYQINESKIPTGLIALRFRSEGTNLERDKVVIMNGNGDKIQEVAESTGSAGSIAWSPDGHYLAVKCDYEICILDMTTVPDLRNDLARQYKYPKIANKIDFPNECKVIAKKREGKPDPRILSISWAADGQEIVIVCGEVNPEMERRVCILPINGSGECWNKNLSLDIFQANWSPADKNLIAISDVQYFLETEKIYLIDAKGSNPVFVANGKSPEWSPSGKQLAFINLDTSGSGIDIINLDGTSRKQIYKNGEMKKYINFECVGFNGVCHLSWSPDGHYLTFVSNNYIGYNYKVFRLDVFAGEIITILDPLTFPYVAEVDWGP